MQGTWAALAGVGVGGNLLVAGAFLIRPWNRTPLQVDRVVGLLALTGLATTLASLPTHLYSTSGQLRPYYLGDADLKSCKSSALFRFATSRLLHFLHKSL